MTRLLPDPPSRSGGILQQRELDAALRVLAALRKPQDSSIVMSWDNDMQDALGGLVRAGYVETIAAYGGRSPRKSSAPFRPDRITTTALGDEYLASIKGSQHAMKRRSNDGAPMTSRSGKRSPAQLDREIAEALSGKSHKGRSAHATKKDFDWASFIDGAAFGFWASPYMTEVNNLHETSNEQDDPKKRQAYEAAYRALSPRSGGHWEAVMPEPPPAARAVAKKFTKAVRDQLTDDQLDEIASKFSAHDAGYYGAMQSQGEGVGWHDEGVDVDPPEDFQYDTKLQNAVYAGVARKVREAGIKLPRRA